MGTWGIDGVAESIATRRLAPGSPNYLNIYIIRLPQDPTAAVACPGDFPGDPTGDTIRPIVR
jgi:hypothetical protein